ncbi:S24 family peptidase [Sphingobacterium psychroaquaticum]|uniref:Phage repressor protein C, contains Cro/C1-type HTH and peptisase s24 domains n=1 Tax=Sphingobacterium psychroaquaticum TaxID=561061 RepID=A0A1X7K503_9SPHI|nr:S24 family peptidase [Sphingobacterium psychroaquaticum]SMG35819.1 Phage repressor protein C, contains Cro/C1-type HTH and peptisase s24 domains [Sphingobacterium psychroaquaticum]
MIVDRILQLIDFKGINKSQFYKQTGLSNGFLDKVKDIGSSKLENILKTYTDISAEWLLTGNGSMIKPIQKQMIGYTGEQQPSSDKPPIQGETKSEYLLRTDHRRMEQLVPLYNIEASAGLVQLFGRDQTTPIDYISIPNLPACDGAIYVTGDSMYPLLKSGDIVMYKQVLDVFNSLFWGEMYIVHIDIDGDAFTTVKYVHRSDQGTDYIKLVSQNQHHSPKEVHLKHVKAAALVKASIRINSMI